ncbi:hypothetical protein CEP51_002841 [Fusarium floridanum]|uniref:Uncharacterized protein n=1 Tax=Fusarium floridanum TaxID=1325733 RepID=A0A428S9A7_9HYPO|nr:hypothetical protein CEP51_002841 [Fusarium floridanum]
MAKQWDANRKRKREPCKLPRNAKILQQSINLKRKRQVTDVGGTPKAQRVSQAPQSNKATPATKRGRKNRPRRGHKPPNNPNGRTEAPNPQYLGPYLVTNPPERNPEPGSPNIPNPKEPNTSTNPQYLGPYPVTSYPETNTKSEPVHIPNSPKKQDAPVNPENIGAHTVTNIQKGNLGKERPSAKFPYSENYPEANGRRKRRRKRQRRSRNSPGNSGTRRARNPYGKSDEKREAGVPNRQKNPEVVEVPPDSQDVGTHPVAHHLEVAFPEPQLEPPEGLDPKGLQTSASPQKFHTHTLSTISPQLAISLRKQIYQKRPSPARRHSTGNLPVRNKLSNKFIMGIPKQRFGISKRRDSTASAAPVMTAEYCNDPFRAAIKERLAAGESRAPPRSEFALNSRIYHTASEYAKRLSELQKGVDPGQMKQVMSSITGMAYAIVVNLRTIMRYRWVGYDEFATYPGHCRAIEYNRCAMEEFFGEAMPAMLTIGAQLKAPSPRPRVNRKKGRDCGRPFDRCLSGRVGKRYQKSKKNRLLANIKELKQGV